MKSTDIDNIIKTFGITKCDKPDCLFYPNRMKVEYAYSGLFKKHAITAEITYTLDVCIYCKHLHRDLELYTTNWKEV